MSELIAGFKRLHVTKHKFWRWPKARREYYYARSYDRFRRRPDAFTNEEMASFSEFGRYETVRFIAG